jgi:hypothetical protein
MEKKYNILWIEDEPEKQEAFVEEAFLEGIQVFQFSTNKSGMEELISDLNAYDAVILDAKGFEETEDEVAKLTGLMNSISTLKSLSKRIPYFIYSGYLDKDENASVREFLSNEEIFTKGKDTQRLFERIKEEADKQIDTQIKHEYARVFEVSSEKYLGLQVFQPLLELIKQAKELKDFESSKDHLSAIRKIIEKSFERLAELTLIPEEIYKAGINPTVKFICYNKYNSEFTPLVEYMHPTIAYFLDNLVFVLQDSQHDKSDLKLKVHEYISDIKSPYFFKSLVFQLLDYLIWFKCFIDKYETQNQEKKIWLKKESIITTVENSEWIIGSIIKIADNGWGTFLPNNSTRTIGIHPNEVSKLDLNEGDIIKVLTKPSPDQTKTYIKEIKLL